MGVACEVYTKLLFKRGHGHPLWEPEPTQSGEVLIGDVGYMLDGGFYRLFNATLPAAHLVNERHGVPDGYELLALPDTLKHHRPHALQAGPICSKSVTAVSADASMEVGTGAIGPAAHLRFKFSDEQGAVLVLKNDAHREVLHPCRDLTQYILLNHAGWHEFARNVCRLDIKSQDIIFVCGWVKTAEWALAAATHRARDGEIAFGGDFGPAGQASFSVSATHEISMSWEHRRGPNGTQGEGEKASTFDQCVFLHYYKVKHRPFFVPKVLRAATEEEHSSRSSTPNGSDYMESVEDGCAMSVNASFESDSGRVEVVPRPSEQSDMVDAMLDYILDQTDATCAIVSDRDIAMLSSQQGQVDIPENLPQLLVDKPPNLTVTNGVGMLPCHNAPIHSAELQGIVPAALPPMVQFVAGPPRILPHYRAWSASRSRRSRSRSQPATRALSPSSAFAKPSLSQPNKPLAIPDLSQLQSRISHTVSQPSPVPIVWSLDSISQLAAPQRPRLNIDLESTTTVAGSPDERQCSLPRSLSPFVTYDLASMGDGWDESRAWPPHNSGVLSATVLAGEDEDLFALDDGESVWPQQEQPPEGSFPAPVPGPSPLFLMAVDEAQFSANVAPVENLSLPAQDRPSQRPVEEKVGDLLESSSTTTARPGLGKNTKKTGRKMKVLACKSKRMVAYCKEAARSPRGKEKGKGKETTQKRARSPSALVGNADEDEQEDERPAKRARQQAD